MKRINESLLNSIVSKVLTETLEERADELASKIKSHMEESDDNICECGGMMYEGVCNECGKSYVEEEVEEDIYDVSKGFPKPKKGQLVPPAQEFDYVQEEDDMEEEPKLNTEACKYHMERFGPNDEVTMEVCGTLKESLKGKQNKLDVAKPKGKLTSDDFKKLRSMKKGETKEGKKFPDLSGDGKVTRKDILLGRGVKLKESETFIQKATEKMEKKGTEGSFKKYCGGEVTMACIKKAMKSDDPKLVKKANFAKNIKAYKGTEHKESVTMTESEMVDFIEKIVTEQKNKLKSMGIPKGMEVYNKVHKADGKENEDAIKAVDKKMKEYLKDGSKGEYDMNPKMFPLGNGQIQKMAKKAYVPSDAVQDYVDAFTAAGLENLTYDEIHPNEEWVDKNVEGSSVTGNNPEWANAVDTGVNKKRNKIRKDNLLGAVKQQAYNKSPQPIVSDESGEANQGKFNKNLGKGSMNKANKILNTLESVEPKEDKKLNEEFEKMKKLISYNKKTQ